MADLPVLESRLDRRQGVLTAGVCAAVLGLGLWLQHFLITMLGSAGLAVGLWSLLDRRVKLRVDGIGIWYSEWGASPVQWAEIAGVETRVFRGTEQICMLPREPDLLLARMPPGFRWKSWLVDRFWHCRFVISTARLEHGTPLLVEILRRYHRARAGE